MATIYTKILSDVLTLIGQAAPGVAVVVRKKLLRLEHDPLPLCLVVPNFQAQSREGFEGFMERDRRVGVALIFKGNMTLESGLGQMIDAIDAVQRRLNVTSLPTASSGTDPGGVFDSVVSLDPPFDTQLLDEANLDYSLMEITYRCAETRN